tara:strand:+ start:471 stop:935 length:465 start_codon:yes stop_codon:yes gene_type:complete
MKSRKNSEKDIGQISTYHSGVAQASAHRRMNRIKTDFLLSYGLSPMQWFAIGYIYDAGEHGVRMSDLAKSLETTLPYITNTIAILEGKGIISKKSHEGDSRIKLLCVNKSYKKTVVEIESLLRQRLREELYGEDHISRDELATYIHVLYKIIGK